MVTTAINLPAEGHVKFSGSFWRAEADEAIAEGETVIIIKQVKKAQRPPIRQPSAPAPHAPQA